MIGFGPQKASLQYIWSLLEKLGRSYEVDFWGIRLAYTYGNFVDEEAGIRYLEESLSTLQGTNRTWELATAYLCLVKLQIPQLIYDVEKEAVLERYIVDALNIFTRLGDELNVSYALIQLGNLRIKQERLEEAIEQWRSAHAALTRLDEWAAASSVTRLMGDAYLQLGQFEAGFDCFDQIARICFEHGHAQDAVGALSKESFEMVRYGDLEEARRIRQECIDIIQTTGPEYQVGWNYWEMGEILRVMGSLGEAKDWYERARKPFESFEDNVWKIFYFRGFGDIALAGGNYLEACRYFLRSLDMARITRHDWAMAYALSGLGKSELGLEDIETAQIHLRNALQHAFKTGERGIILFVLAGYTQLRYEERDLEMAVQLGSLVKSHYATWHETRDEVSRILVRLKKLMTAAEFEQAQKKGQALDLWKMVGNSIVWQKPPSIKT